MAKLRGMRNIATLSVKCQEICPGGGIGRRSRLKICRSQDRAGSIPVLGTKVDKSKNNSVCPFLFWMKLLSRLYVSSKAPFLLGVRLWNPPKTGFSGYVEPIISRFLIICFFIQPGKRESIVIALFRSGSMYLN